ncbi:hypothetical protein BDW62DRAFT_204396 [Aspergillus aurantiobrunneus]
MTREEFELYSAYGPELVSIKEGEAIELGAQWVLILRSTTTHHCTLYYYAARDSIPGDSDDGPIYEPRVYRTEEFPYLWFKKDRVKLIGIIQEQDRQVFEGCFFDELPIAYRFAVLEVVRSLASHGIVDKLVMEDMVTAALNIQGEMRYNGDGWGELDVKYIRNLDDYVTGCLDAK